MHACIENHVKNKSVFTQDQWIQHMKEAKQTGEKYKVKEINQSQIQNFETISHLFNWTLAKTSTIKEIIIRPDEDFFETRVDLRNENHEKPDDVIPKPKKIKIKKKIYNLTDLKDNEVNPAHEEKIPLTISKKKDIELMLEKGYIPKQHCSFYNNILKD